MEAKLDKSPKDLYMDMRALRKTLCMDQIAFYAPDEAAVEDVKRILGLQEADWTEDLVTGRVSVFSEPETESRARLLFNYDLGIEVEILTYLHGPNWHRHRGNDWTGPQVRPGAKPFVSHIGLHVNDEELPTLPFPIAQRMVTTDHSNPAIANRSYEYVIYDTKPLLGVDLKYIKRLS